MEVKANVVGGTIVLSGDIDGHAGSTIDGAYDEILRGGAGALALDFAAVSYINSTGIAVIVGLLARARRDGVSVSAFGLTDHYKQVFEITRLSDFMTIHDGVGSNGKGSE